MNPLLMAAQAMLFLILATALLTLVGLGVVQLLSPNIGGLQLLLAPAIGLGILYIACQWVTPFLPSSLVVPPALGIGTIVSLAVAVRWRSRLLTSLRACSRDLLLAGTGAVLTYAALLSHAVSLRVFTLSAPPNDGLYDYAPTAEFMRTHAFSAGSVPHDHTPFLPILRVFGTRLYPGSMGTVEGGLSTVFNQPVHALLEPFNAVCIALALVGAYVLAVGTLRMGRPVGTIAVALMATSQFLYWAFGQDHVQEIRAAVLFCPAIVLFMHALRGHHRGAAVLAGGLSAAILPLYFPLFVILVAVCAAAWMTSSALALVHHSSGHVKELMLVVMVASVLGVPSVRWIALNGGLQAWRETAAEAIPPAHYYSISFPLSHLMGVAPIAELYRFAPLLYWGGAWSVIAPIAAIVLLALGGIGLIALVWRGPLTGAAVFLGASAVVAGIVMGTPNTYGKTKLAASLLPFTAILIALGVATVGRVAAWPVRQTRARPWWGNLIAAATTALILAPIVVLQAGASTETQYMYIQTPSSLGARELELHVLPELIPPGARVLIHDPIPRTPTPRNNATENTPLLTAAAYFLSERDVSVTRNIYLGFGPGADIGVVRTPLDPEQLRVFRYIIIPDAPGAIPAAAHFHRRWTAPSAGLALYESAPDSASN